MIFNNITGAGGGGGSSGSTALVNHAYTHKKGGTDGLSAADIGAQTTITGAATTITNDNLTAARVVATNASGKISVSSVTTTELGRLAGVTSNIQEQIDYARANFQLSLAQHTSDVNNPHGVTAEQIGAIPASDMAYKIYDNLTDIGLTAGSETIADIFNAMPVYSILRYIGTSAHNKTIYPNENQYGQVEFVKLNTTYGHATFWADSNSASVRGTYELYKNGSNTYGWYKVYTQENKPTATDVGAVPLDGSGTMTGNLSISKAGAATFKGSNTTTGREVYIETTSDNFTAIANRVIGDTANRTMLWLAPETQTDVDQLLRIYRAKTGETSKTYKVLHTGNMDKNIKIHHAGTTAPTNTNLFWIDTNATSGGLKYYDGSAWVHVPVAWT